MKSAFLLMLGIAGFAGGIGLQYYRQPDPNFVQPQTPSQGFDISTLEGKIVSINYPGHLLTFTSVDHYSYAATTFQLAFNDQTAIFNETNSTSSPSEELLNSLKNKRIKIYFPYNQQGLVAAKIVAPVTFNNF